jgi:two-component system cell cycle sensor histidine kinase/response regulator CckA
MVCEYQYGTNRKSSLQDKVNLAIALVFLAIFVGAACYPELDSSYAAAAQAAENVRGAVAVHQSEASGGRTILVVENDDGQRLVAKSALEHYGYNVVLADNREQALAVLRKAAHPVALMLIGGTHIETAAIRQLESARPDVPVLLSEPLRGKHKAGASMRVERPFSAVPLATAVGEALAKK